MEVQNYQNNRKPKNRNSSALRILMIVFCVLIIGAGVSIYVLYGLITDDNADSLFVASAANKPVVGNTQNSIQVANNDVTQPEQAIPGLVEYNGKRYVKNESIVNLLFLGIDTNTERKKKMEGYRSDMVMVCAVDTEAKKATLISIPRDTYTTVYKVDKKTGEVKEVFQDKINSAYSYGGGAERYSFQNAMACVQLFLQRECELQQPLNFTLDIPVYHYAGIDMDGITQVASAVGGVQITLEQSIPGVGKKGQTVKLKYQNAEDYIRNRHDVSNGDLDRARRQQKFMLALAKKIKSMGAVDIILSLYDELQRYVHTKLTTDQMLDLAKVLMKTDIDTIEFHTITGPGDTHLGPYFMFHDEQATLELLLDIYYEQTA